MPLPSRRKGEEKNDFISRCIKELSDKGEGEDISQRAAICHSRAAFQLTDDEIDAMNIIVAEEKRQLPPPQDGDEIKNLNLKKKQKKKRHRMFKEDETHE